MLVDFSLFLGEDWAVILELGNESEVRVIKLKTPQRGLDTTEVIVFLGQSYFKAAQVAAVQASVLILFGTQSIAMPSITQGTVQPREAIEQPELYFGLESPEVREISNEELLRINPNFSRTDLVDFGNCDQNRTSYRESEANPLEVVDLVVDQIINIGKKIWNVVAAGRPAANFKTDVAYALPRGIKCWTELSNWSIPTSRNYQVSYKNKFGVEVIQFTYQLTYTHGGRAGDVGAYITNATILPAHINVAWGFSFDATAEVPSVFNVGSMSQPVGAMQINMMWKVENVLTFEQKTKSYFINGLGDLQQL